MRTRPEVRRVLRDSGRVQIALASLPDRAFADVAGALGGEGILAPHLPEHARAVVRGSPVEVGVKATPEGRRATVGIRTSADAIGRHGFFFGLAPRVEFLAAP